MGIINPLSQKEINRILKIDTDDNNIKNILNNYIPLKCIYTKGHPTFTEPPSEILNPGKYMWDFKSFDKSIDITAQTFAILCLCISSEILYESDVAQGTIMIKSARMFYDFISTYLRNDDGLFISGEDKTKNFEKEIKIKLDEKNTNLSHQIFAFEAILYLYRMISNVTLKEYHYTKCEKYLNEALSLFEYIYSNYTLLLNLSTKELAQCVSSLSRCILITENKELKEKFKYLILYLCAEIEARIKITGEVEQGFEDDSITTIITHFSVSSSLLEGYINTNVDKFKDISSRIYSSLQDLYDPSLGLFIIGDYSKIGYSIKDIAEVVKSLVLYNMVNVDNQSFLLLKEFYNFLIEESGIIQSIVQNTINLNDNDIFLDEKLPLMEEINKAPIFLKNVKINFNKKNTTFKVSKSFNSIYSLYASYLLLFYFNLPSEVNDLC